MAFPNMPGTHTVWLKKHAVRSMPRESEFPNPGMSSGLNFRMWIRMLGIPDVSVGYNESHEMCPGVWLRVVYQLYPRIMAKSVS